jgi:hypothetical protein
MTRRLAVLAIEVDERDVAVFGGYVALVVARPSFRKNQAARRKNQGRAGKN